MDSEILHPDGYHAPNDPINYFHTIPSSEAIAYQRLTKVESALQYLAIRSGVVFVASCFFDSQIPAVVTGGTTVGLAMATIAVKSARRALFDNDLE